MSQHDSRGGDAEQTFLALALLLVMLGVGCWLLWHAFHAEIAAAVIATQRVLIHAAAAFTDRFDLLDRQLATVDPAAPDVTAGKLYRLAHNVGAFYRWPAVAVLLGLAALCFRRVGTAQFRRRFDLDGLMREQARNFRFTAAFVGRGLGPVLPARGEPRPADPTLHVGEWIDRFARRTDGEFDHAGARHVLAQQLGPVWTGRVGAAPHVRAMFAAFSLHAARRREEAAELLGDIAEALPCNPKDGPAGPAAPLVLPARVVDKADRYLSDPAVAGPCDRVAGRHAFTQPALMSVLTYARERAGILNPGMFAFLQLMDRRLFLALDALGFPIQGTPWHRSPLPSCSVEAAGAREHWTAECEAGRPLFVPVIDASSDGIRAKAGDDQSVR